MEDTERQILELTGGSLEIETVAECRVCGGRIVEKTVFHPAVHDPHGVIGPGYRPLRNSWKESRYHCGGCGIKYEFMPGRER